MPIIVFVCEPQRRQPFGVAAGREVRFMSYTYVHIVLLLKLYEVFTSAPLQFFQAMLLCEDEQKKLPSAQR